MRLVLVRHGESLWNKENRFCGWVDVDLSEQGIREARKGGRLLKEGGFAFDLAYTSVLVRATHTLTLLLEELGQQELPIKQSWRLNERFYGALQGLNKAETSAKYGEAQVKLWRRSYDVRPPALTTESPMWPGKDPKYADVPKEELPLTECLKDTEARVLPYWNEEILPRLQEGKRILISAHGNSIRAIVRHLERLSGEEIAQREIPTGYPLVYELDEQLRVAKGYYLGDPEEVARKQREVAEQAKAK